MANVLVVDAEPRISEVIRKVLSAGNHAVSTAQTLSEARSELEQGRFEIIISDMDFSADHHAVIEAMKPEPVVLVTGLLPTKPVVLEALRQGAFRFLTKPLSMRDLVSIVSEAEKEFSRRKAAS